MDRTGLVPQDVGVEVPPRQFATQPFGAAAPRRSITVRGCTQPKCRYGESLEVPSSPGFSRPCAYVSRAPWAKRSSRANAAAGPAVGSSRAPPSGRPSPHRGSPAVPGAASPCSMSSSEVVLGGGHEPDPGAGAGAPNRPPPRPVGRDRKHATGLPIEPAPCRGARDRGNSRG